MEKQEVTKIFNELKKRIRENVKLEFVENWKLDKSYGAVANVGEGKVELNWSKLKEYDGERIKQIISHEFGHFVHNRMENFKGRMDKFAEELNNYEQEREQIARQIGWLILYEEENNKMFKKEV